MAFRKYRLGDKVKTRSGQVGFVEDVATWRDTVIHMERSDAEAWTNEIKSRYGKDKYHLWSRVYVCNEWHEADTLTPVEPE